MDRKELPTGIPEDYLSMKHRREFYAEAEFQIRKFSEIISRLQELRIVNYDETLDKYINGVLDDMIDLSKKHVGYDSVLKMDGKYITAEGTKEIGK